jgi:hypothetical protein
MRHQPRVRLDQPILTPAVADAGPFGVAGQPIRTADLSNTIHQANIDMLGPVLIPHIVAPILPDHQLSRTTSSIGRYAPFT